MAGLRSHAGPQPAGHDGRGLAAAAGKTEWNAAERFQGRLSLPLTARGREQAARLGRTLARALAGRPGPPVHVSPLGRARDTADIVRRCVPGLGSAAIEPRLREVSTGAWDVLTRAEIEAGWLGLLEGASRYDRYFRAPGGEPYSPAPRLIETPRKRTVSADRGVSINRGAGEAATNT